MFFKLQNGLKSIIKKKVKNINTKLFNNSMKMKNLTLLLIIILIASGCSLFAPKPADTEEVVTIEEPSEEETPITQPETEQEQPEEIPPAAEEKPEEEPTIPVEVQTKFKVGEGQSIEVNKTKLTVKEIHSDSKTLIDVEGESVMYTTTMQNEIINGLDIKFLKFSHKGSGNPENYVELEVKPLQLGPNEYLLEKNWKKVAIEGNNFELLDTRVTDQWIWVSVSGNINTVVDMPPGNSKRANGLLITSVRQFYFNKPYAIVRIEKV